ncbi:MAG: DUF86 domain-containing protein [Phycisphaeraceae bacterium]
MAHLAAIAESIRLIHAYVDGVGCRHYCENAQISDAVERRFAIIGEALTRLKRDAPEVHATIDHTAEIAAFRNIIIHAYDQLDFQVFWEVIHRDLPTLERQIQAAIEQNRGA